jgi:hypothetical protein
MSKNKEVEKKLEKELEKRIDKIKPEKELKIEKNEKFEIKEKPEKREIKEYKEKKEFKEFKEHKEFKEIKEVKEIDKQVFEKGGKELAETGGFDPGTVFRAEKPEEGGTAGAAELKAKEIEKIKAEKEFPDKIQKELEKIKPEKEFKEIEKIKPEKEFPDKIQKELEKIKPEKEFEKALVEGVEDPTRGEVFKRTGTPEDRLNELEDAVTKLSHFIGVDLRPDLTTGALKGEPDVTGGEAKTDDKKKPK